MTTQAKRYLITNTSAKPYDAESGEPDTRTNLEKRGHAVEIRDSKGGSIILGANSAPRFTDMVDNGMLDLQSQGVISIEEVSDISDVLAANNANKPAKDHEKGKQRNVLLSNTEVSGLSGVAGGAGVDGHGRGKGAPKAFATKTGEENHQARGSRESSEGVNPDGEPNFLAKTSEVKRAPRRNEEKSTGA